MLNLKNTIIQNIILNMLMTTLIQNIFKIYIEKILLGNLSNP